MEITFKFNNGAVVQLGERLPCTEEVAGSNPVSSTNVVVSEWLGRGLQIRLCEFKSHPRLNKEQKIFLFLRKKDDSYY